MAPCLSTYIVKARCSLYHGKLVLDNIETMKALSYLHFTFSTPIIHKDVNSSDILLDSNYTTKVLDFGSLRLVPLDQTKVAITV